jgi:hypothetical protein
LLDKRPLSGLAIREEDLGGKGLVQVKANMHLGFPGRAAVVGPLHGGRETLPLILARQFVTTPPRGRRDMLNSIGKSNFGIRDYLGSVPKTSHAQLIKLYTE